MKKTEFTRFDDYLHEQFLQYRTTVNVTPKSFLQFKKEQGNSQQLHRWLTSLRGLSLTNNQMQSVTKSYLQTTKKTYNDIPALHAMLKKRYDMNLPETVLAKPKPQFWRKFVN